MEHKAWLWKRKSSEKLIPANERSEFLKEKALELERSLEDLNEQLSSVRIESSAKDDLLANQAKVAEEAIAGWKKAEAEASSFKQQVDDALLHKEMAEEKVVHLEAAVKECMQQLRNMKEDQQLIIKNAAMKISREQEKMHKLEESLSESNKKLSELVVENTNLSRILELKEQLIKDLGDSKSKSDAKCMEVAAKLDTAEKSNSSLKYEVCMLQKELDIRNQEKEFNLRSADVAHRQQLESLKKIAKLESECQKLRVMIRKRLPGPAALAKMRNEVEMLGFSTSETQKKRSNTNGTFVVRDSLSEDNYDALSKNGTSLTERLHALEDENRNLKDSLTKKSSELQDSQIMFARTASKLSQVETQLEALSKGHASHEITRASPVSCEMPLKSISENGGDVDNISCAESWASALMSELEHFRSGKSNAPSCRSTIMSDLSLMDDFVEMEKLAIVSPDKGLKISSKSCHSCTEVIREPTLLESASKKLAPVESLTDFSEANKIKSTSFENYPNWLQDIIRVIIEKHHIAQKSLDTILNEVKIALADMEYPVASKTLLDTNHTSKGQEETRDTSLIVFDGTTISYIPNSNSITTLEPKLEKHILRLIELVHGIIQRSISCKNDQHMLSGDIGHFPSDNNNDQRLLSGYVTRTLSWKGSELYAVLQNFLVICNELLHGKADVEKYISEVVTCLDWLINNCFSLQDASDMKQSIKKHFDADVSQGDDGHSTKANTSKDMDILDGCEEPNSSSQRSENGLHMLFRKENIESKSRTEHEKLKSESISLESRKMRDLEGRLMIVIRKNETLTIELQESEKKVSELEVELAALRDSKRLIEDQIESQKLVNEDLSTQLTAVKAELNEARQKFSSLAMELEEKSNCYEELEATCLELQLQLESVSSKETAKYIMGQEEKQEMQIRADHEIAAASQKLAACQETILNLGKQFKALASPRDAPLFDKVISSPAPKSNCRTQLLDHMRADDDAKSDELKSPKTKEIICTEASTSPSANSQNKNAGLFYRRKFGMDDFPDNSLKAIIQQSAVKSPGRHSSFDSYNNHTSGSDGVIVLVPKPQNGGISLFKKLLMRRRKDKNKKISLPSAR